MRAGAEPDLSKAFDTVDYLVAEAALLHHGVHTAVCHLVRQAWAAPRHCCVHGALAVLVGASRKATPCRLPLGFVLAPWAPFPGGSGRWAYMDDRTLAELDTAPRGALQHGLEATAAFDAAVGLQENAAKRQVWVAGEGTVVEHLGLRLKPDDPSFPICPRDSWAGASEVIARLATIPGPASVREHLASAFVLPYFRWAAPLLHPAPRALAPRLFRAVLATDCSWWCPGRWWAQRVQLHPVLGAAVHCVKRASICARSAQLVQLGFVFESLTVAGGLQVSLPRGADPRLRHLVESRCGPVALADGSLRFRADTPPGLHCARQAARLVSLGEVSRGRQDVDGLGQVDVEASCHPVWKRWVAALCHRDAWLLGLSLWRVLDTHTPFCPRSCRCAAFCLPLVPRPLGFRAALLRGLPSVRLASCLTCGGACVACRMVDFAGPCHFQIGLDLLGCCGFGPGACFRPGCRLLLWTRYHACLGSGSPRPPCWASPVALVRQ